MKPQRTTAWLGGLLALLTAADPALAQTPNAPAPAGTAATAAKPDEAVVLSPFEVSTARDTGFAAASAVAGGRLAIDLKDAPVAYSVLNKEFLDALQITGLEQAADWAPNTTRVPDHGHENTWGGSVLVSSRGVSSFFAQRDFFQMQMDFDSYNLDRFDYGRGPNAVLFGFASFGGTQNVVSKQARLDRNVGETRLSYGSWDFRRATVDYNQRVGNNAAVRVNLMGQRAQGWRDGEFNNRRGIHIAGKVRLGQRTEIRAEAERGKLEANTPYHTYYDGVLGWNGAKTYDSRRNTESDSATTGVVSYGNFNNNVNTFIYSPMQSTSSIIDVMGTGRTNGVTSNRIGGATFVGANNFNLAPVIADPYLPANRYATAIANSKLVLPGEDNRFGLTNTPLNARDYRIGSVYLTHQMGNFYFEMASNHSFNERLAYQHVYAGTGINLYIDVNQFLPNGQPNPMFREPYTEGRLQRRHDDWRGRNHRLSAAYVADNTRFGSYTFQTMIGSAYSDRYYASDSFQVLRGTETANWNQGSEQVMFRRYINHPASFDLNLPSTVSYTTSTGVAQTANAGWLPGFNEENRKVKFGQASIRGRWFDSKLIGIASGRVDDVYRQGRRTPNNRDLVGKNWDPYKALFLPFISQKEWSSLTYIPKDAAGNPTGPALPAISVPRDAQGFRLPQYAGVKFQNDDFSPPPLEATTRSYFAGLVYHLKPWVSLAVNYSQGADYNDAPQKFDGSTFPMRKSEGKDVSLRFTLLGGRLNTTVTYYQGEEENEGINTGNLGIARWGSFNTILSSNRLGDLSENGINARGVPLVVSPGWDSRIRKNEGFEFDTIANITRNWRLSFNFALPKAVQEDTAPDFRNYFDANQGALRQILADSGILINSSNVASLDLSVPAAQRAPNNEHQNAADAWTAVYTDRQNIVTGEQDLARSMKFIGNIYTDYRFPSGTLKGLKVGGGLNYRGAQVIGYKGSDNIADPTQASGTSDDKTVGPYDTVKSDAYYNLTLNLGYSWKKSERLTFDFDFKVDNLLDDHDPIYIGTVLRPRTDLSSPARVTVPGGLWWRQTPRNYTFSVTTKF